MFMKRILISQNEKNNSEDYVVVDGNLIDDKELGLHYYRKVSKADNWKHTYKDDFFELKNKNNNIFIKSHYSDKDDIHRNIYYLYLIENKDLDVVLDYLEKDSQQISRKIDRDKTLEVIKKIKANERLKSYLFKLILVLAVASIAYIIINTLID